MPVELAMRYGGPSIESRLVDLIHKEKDLDEIYLIPLYPHYAMASSETAVVEVQRALKKLQSAIRLTVHPPFYDASNYIQVLVESARPYLEQDFDLLLFSYHGMPERHCRKTDPTGNHCLQVDDCCFVPSVAHETCYRHQVFRTTEEFVRTAGIPEEKYAISFQSRLGVDSWLKPSTTEEIIRLAEAGVKNMLVICPAFVSDCLETLEEIGLRERAAFLDAGGESLQLIPCLNDHPDWVKVLARWCVGDD